MIQGLEDSIGSQVAVVIVNTINGKDLNKYSFQIFGDLGLGRKVYNDGVLITVAYQDRKTRMEVGYGLEKIIKDEVAARIIREDMIPKFQEQKVYEGVYAAIAHIKNLIEENKSLVGQKPY